eukprot:TRINITY_DN45272_c0_g1_i1.p1 TRINITY_DN45272_c0_g1~~TRINITY_DN45272_c0_g1_i1.p1  ORF type:complete len:158 (+),score=19.26 TRINITY_DN45272_c0_g1_i1:260-733(+)
MEGSIPKNSSVHPSLRADGADTVTTAKIQQQELLIASLQTQLNSINQRMVTGAQAAGQQGYGIPTAEGSPIYGGGSAAVSPSSQRGRSGRAAGGLDTSLGGDQSFHRSISQQSGGLRRGAPAAEDATGGGESAKKRQSNLSYSPELEQLLSFANSIE